MCRWRHSQRRSQRPLFLGLADCQQALLHVTVWGWVPNRRANSPSPGHWTQVDDGASAGQWSDGRCLLYRRVSTAWAFPDLRVVAGADSRGRKLAVTTLTF